MRGSYIPEAISNVATLGPRVGCFALMAPQGRLTRGVVPATADHGSAFHCTDAVRDCMQRQPRPRAGQATGKGGLWEQHLIPAAQASTLGH
jgi:hypothetical protein